MRSTRSFLLVVSAILVACLLGGGLAVKVGAGESSFHQVVVFSEVLSLVLENYVDPVEADRLLTAAYEGMLGGLDAHGAYLTAEEVREWKAGNDGALAHPGFAVLKAGRSLQVVSVDEGSPAAEAGIEIGDQIRSIDGRPIRDIRLPEKALISTRAKPMRISPFWVVVSARTTSTSWQPRTPVSKPCSSSGIIPNPSRFPRERSVLAVNSPTARCWSSSATTSCSIPSTKSSFRKTLISP